MSAPGSILVTRLSALGDVVLASCVASALRERFPSARVEFLSQEPHGRILRWVRGLDAVHLWSPAAPPPEGALAREWDVVVDLSATSRSRRLLQAVRTPRLLRVRKQVLRRFAFVRLRGLGASSRGLVSVLDRLFATVASLGVTRDGRRPRLDVAAPPADGPVLIAPGAGRATKRWPAARFAELARRLASEDGERTVIAGAASERALLEAVANGAASAEVLCVADPAELPPRVARCPLAVTNDSGLLHVAEACGADVVAIFGPTHPALGFAPASPGSVVVRTDISCSPCDLHGPERCPKGHHRCMEDVSVERVLAEVRARRPAAVRA
ncbi:MAG: glycosyltransferase family 9 protein [bacterium]